MFHTTVANVVFVVGASPLITALLAWVVLRERLSALSWTVLALALVGIAVMVGEGLTEGRLIGSVIAFGAAVTFSMLVILLRLSRHTDMLAATSLAGLVSAVICLFVLESLAVTTHDLVISLTLGAVQTGLGFTFITYASRYIPAAEVTLLALVETILAPIWTWLVAGEVPGLATLGGGAMVLVCVGLFALTSLREEGTHDSA
jgi:drug/metabolite transporter (DMT)-like permease